MTFERSSPLSVTTAAHVSSQLVSMARIIALDDTRPRARKTSPAVDLTSDALRSCAYQRVRHDRRSTPRRRTHAPAARHVDRRSGVGPPVGDPRDAHVRSTDRRAAPLLHLGLLAD